VSVNRSAFEVRKVGLHEFARHLNLTASEVVASACIVLFDVHVFHGISRPKKQ